MDKIGIGIITCNREAFFRKCLASIPSEHYIVVVNDGTHYDPGTYMKATDVIQHETNQMVAISKNDALHKMMDNRCDHLFLIEDDMIIKDPNVFNEYIKLSKSSGIQHFNFAYHGPANKRDGVPTPRKIIHKDDYSLSLNANCVGSFSYYTRKAIETVGYLDERFKNSWEHVEHTYRLINERMHPPFWWFADLVNSYDYIDEQACSTENTTIPRTPEWKFNMINGAKTFIELYGYEPVKIPHFPVEYIDDILTTIKQKNVK